MENNYDYLKFMMIAITPTPKSSYTIKINVPGTWEVDAIVKGTTANYDLFLSTKCIFKNKKIEILQFTRNQPADVRTDMC